MLHHQGLALDEEMIHEERVQDRERALAEGADPYGQGPAPRRPGNELTSTRPAWAASTRSWPSGWWRARSACSRRPGPRVEVHDVPGAFELPLAAQYCADTGRYAGVACLGAVIRGETDHYDFVCSEAASGIARVSLDTGVPCAFGVLTVENMEQALARSGGGKRHQGEDAAASSGFPSSPRGTCGTTRCPRMIRSQASTRTNRSETPPRSTRSKRRACPVKSSASAARTAGSTCSAPIRARCSTTRRCISIRPSRSPGPIPGRWLCRARSAVSRPAAPPTAGGSTPMGSTSCRTRTGGSRIRRPEAASRRSRWTPAGSSGGTSGPGSRHRRHHRSAALPQRGRPGGLGDRHCQRAPVLHDHGEQQAGGARRGHGQIPQGDSPRPGVLRALRLARPRLCRYGQHAVDPRPERGLLPERNTGALLSFGLPGRRPGAPVDSSPVSR